MVNTSINSAILSMIKEMLKHPNLFGILLPYSFIQI